MINKKSNIRINLKYITISIISLIILFLIYFYFDVLAFFIYGRLPLRTRQIRNQVFLGSAVNTYYDIYKSFPAAFITDEHGKPMHSWRVLILPYLGEEELYKQYRFDEPWDGPHNRLLLNSMPEIYKSPISMNGDPTVTNYVAVVDPRTLWHGASNINTHVKDSRYPQKNISPPKILIVEWPESDIKWLEPRDISFDKALKIIHPGSFYIQPRGVSGEIPKDATPQMIEYLLNFGEEKSDEKKE
jgi:hypothetical protein